MTSIDPGRDGRAYLSVARSIGARLAKQALFDGDRCTWTISVFERDGASTEIHSQPAGGALYRGSSGVALFLAELFRIDGDAKVRRVAAAALRHAVDFAAELPANSFGFHSGRVGVAYALARYGKTCGAEEFISLAHDVLAPLRGKADLDVGLDVIAGAAGAIPPLLRLAGELDRQEYLEISIALGKRILAAADRGVRGWSWRAASDSNLRNLTGLAHGASGFGHALLELCAATGDSTYLYAAEQAFQYERSWYDAGAKNWPDFRNLALWEALNSPPKLAALRRLLRDGRAPEPFQPGGMVAWCHGAAGIGLARLRAFELLGEDIYLSEAAQAARTTVEHTLQQSAMGYSLCHGVLGNCEFLMRAAGVLGDASVAAVAVASAERAMREYEMAGNPWPSRQQGAISDVSLMLGDAGIGYFYLRLADPTVPSILLVEGEGATISRHDAGRYEAAREAHIDEFFGIARRAFARLSSPPLLPEITPACSPVEVVAVAVKDTVRSTDGPLQQQLEDAARLDLARYDLTLAITDLTDELFETLRRPPATAISWETTMFALGPSARLVETEWDWAAWKDEPLPPDTGAATLLFRREGGVRFHGLGPFATAVFRTLDEWRSVEDILTILLSAAQADDDPGWRNACRPRVIDQLRTAFEAGIVVSRPVAAHSH